MAQSDTPNGHFREYMTSKIDYKEITPPLDEETIQECPCKEPQISLHDLLEISNPHTLKLVGYIKHEKVIVLIDSNNTHNFIHHQVAEKH
jgi:hypothetical protein